MRTPKARTVDALGRQRKFGNRIRPLRDAASVAARRNAVPNRCPHCGLRIEFTSDSMTGATLELVVWQRERWLHEPCPGMTAK